MDFHSAKQAGCQRAREAWEANGKPGRPGRAWRANGESGGPGGTGGGAMGSQPPGQLARQRSTRTSTLAEPEDQYHLVNNDIK